jgi:opacity protein-like surface antigen
MHHAITLSLALSLLSGVTMAQTMESKAFYGSVGYARLDDSTFEFGAVTARLGAQFTPNLGVEGEASFGIEDDGAEVSAGGDIRTKLSYDAALYGVGRLPLGDRFSLLARIGYGTTRIKATGTSANTHHDEQSLNYGLGAQFDFDDSNGLRADWTRRAFDGADADVYALSYVRRF